MAHDLTSIRLSSFIQASTSLQLCQKKAHNKLRLSAGAFVGPDGKSLPVPEELPNAHMRLFGGAQYHRAMAEFRLGMGELICPDISREEIVNACGIDDFHDGVNYTRTACVIAVSKARDMFEPFLHQASAPLPALIIKLGGIWSSIRT